MVVCSVCLVLTLFQKVKDSVLAEVNSTDMSRCPIHPNLDESLAVQELVSQYLTHQGYVEAARAFSQDVRTGRQSLLRGGDTGRSTDSFDDVNAINRQSKYFHYCCRDHG